MKKLIFILIVGSLFMGCSIMYTTQNLSKSSKVQTGMTTEEVLEIMGEPVISELDRKNGNEILTKMRRYYTGGLVDIEYETDSQGNHDGLYIEFYKSGKMRVVGKYVRIKDESKKDGKWTYYRTDGTEDIFKSKEYRNGVEVR